ncbi:MAG: proton-conducting transporter membrane subunit, partial [Terriglobales bacterium]
MALNLILIATALAALSGVPGLLCAPEGRGGQRLAALGMVLAAAFGWTGAGMLLWSAPAAERLVKIPSVLMTGGLSFGVDGLSAVFLVPIFGLGALGAVYGLDYWSQTRHVRNGRKLRLFWGIAVSAMAVVTVARQSFAFLAGWEIMAVAAFMLLSTEDQDPAVRRSAWLYLIATHLGTLCLFAAFALLRGASGGYQFVQLRVDQTGLGILYAIFFLALTGFGLKAGIMPLHFWLPGAHANAPSHVSALMSGVVIKMGIYGLLRITSLLPQPPLAWGAVVLALGAVSGVAGVLYALAQHDLKRLLAYHSIENIGIILLGLGLALVGRTLHRPIWVVLGLSGCLLHVWNHGLFKALLFLGAGSVQHATRTREIDRLGGLARRMPWTAGLFLVGAVAICGLPPLNGFVSELLIYLGLLRTMGGGEAAWLPAALGLPVLGLIGALALACFVKVYGVIFLGAPRTEVAVDAHEAGIRMLVPMALLALACAAIGLAPQWVERPLARAVEAWTGGMTATASLNA